MLLPYLTSSLGHSGQKPGKGREDLHVDVDITKNCVRCRIPKASVGWACTRGIYYCGMKQNIARLQKLNISTVLVFLCDFDKFSEELWEYKFHLAFCTAGKKMLPATLERDEGAYMRGCNSMNRYLTWRQDSAVVMCTLDLLLPLL